MVHGTEAKSVINKRPRLTQGDIYYYRQIKSMKREYRISQDLLHARDEDYLTPKYHIGK